MSAQEFNITDLTPEQVVALAQAGLIEVNGTSVAADSTPQANGKSKTRALPASQFGAYSTYLKGDEFSNLHPIIRRGKKGLAGSKELKAKLNMLVVTGTCELSSAAYSALGKVMHVNGLASKPVKRGGKVVSRFYAMNLRRDGEPWGSTTEFFTGGGRVRIDHATRQAALVLEDGQEFAPEAVEAIGAVVESIS